MKHRHIQSFISAAVFIVLVTACAAPVSPTPIYESSNLQEADFLSPESPLEQLKKPTPAQRLLNIKLEEAFSNEFAGRLFDKFQLTPAFKNINLLDNFTFTCTLHLENTSGQSYTLDIEGQCHYKPENPSEYLFVVNWGGLCIVDADTLAVITLNSVILLDANSLEEKPFLPDISSFGENTNIVGIYRDEEGNYAIPVVIKESGVNIPIDSFNESILMFNTNGKLVDTFYIGSGYGFSSYTPLGREFRYAEQIFMPAFENNQYMIVPNLTMVCEIDNPEPNSIIFANRYDNGANTLLVAYTANLYSDTAFYYEQDSLIAAMTLPECNPGMFSLYPSRNADDVTTVEWKENQIIKITNNYHDTTLLLDLQNNKADSVYHLNPDHILKWNPPPESPGKQYQILESGVWSMDDPIIYYNSWLHDTKNNQYSFIGIFTNSHGGYGDFCGFIDNDNFYRIKFPGPVTIYNIVDSKPQALFTFADNAIAVTYSSSQRQYYALEISGTSVELSVWDDKGEFLSRHPTEIPLTRHHEGMYKPDISVFENTLCYESPDFDNKFPELEIIIKGTLDLTTFEFVQNEPSI